MTLTVRHIFESTFSRENRSSGDQRLRERVCAHPKYKSQNTIAAPVVKTCLPRSYGLKCVWKKENETASDNIMQWTIGTFIVGAKDAGKDAFPMIPSAEPIIAPEAFESLYNPLEISWVRGRKRAENYVNADHNF